jgi:hypothetical protein
MSISPPASIIPAVPPDDKLCANCHIPQGEIDFDASIKGAFVPRNLCQRHRSGHHQDFQWNGRSKPVVSYTIKDGAGAPLAPST